MKASKNNKHLNEFNYFKKNLIKLNKKKIIANNDNKNEEDYMYDKGIYL